MLPWKRTAETVRFFGVVLALLIAANSPAAAAPDLVFADFEAAKHGQWKAEGSAFGSGPTQGTLPGQMPVTGFRGRRLINSFHGGDGSTGRLISPKFVINRAFIAFLIGGGGYAGETCVNLIVNGKTVRTATGPNTRPGGSERLGPSGWEVRDLVGKRARLEIIDAATGGWGHITLDQIRFSDTKPRIATTLVQNVSRRLTPEKRWLNFPVAAGGPKRRITISADGKTVRTFNIALADDGEPDWWAPADVLEWKGQPLTITVDELPEGSRALETVSNADKIAGSDTLYKEGLRPQFHFSAQRGWLNDPNGLVSYNGEYHLFFQHSPFTWEGDAKYWGQAVSRDMVHWTEIGEALSPDALGEMWSGSAVVDRDNTSGFGKDGKRPLVLIYTAAGKPFVQCLAYSTDGRTFTKYVGNPVLGNITDGNRDPKVFWHAPTKRWVQVVYVGKDGGHTVHFFTSPNLREWTLASVTPGLPGTSFLYECPDFFELPLDGDPKRTKWVLMGANTEYAVGTFDGTTFVPETIPLPGHWGKGYYAPQTFSDEPRNRRIQIGWWQTETRGMPFNQSMSLPLELGLVSTPDGPRLTWTPVKELESLRQKAHRFGAVTVAEAGKTNPLSSVRGELIELRAEFTPGTAREVTLSVRGVPIVYDMARQELNVNGHRAPSPLQSGKLSLIVYADRTGLEVFMGDGLTFVPLPLNLDPANTSLSVSARDGEVHFDRLEVYELKSAWK